MSSHLPSVQQLRAEKPHLTPMVWIQDAQGVDRVIYALQPKQLEAFGLTPLGRPREMGGPIHIGYGGAAGGAKSHFARALATAVAFRWPGSVSIIFRETETDVKKNHVDNFFLEVPQSFEGNRLWSYNGSEMCATWWNGSKTYFGYLKYRTDLNRYQGPSFDCMIFEEATLYPWFLVSWLTGNRLRSNVEGTTPFALYPSNPGGVGHAWYKRLFVTRRFRGDERDEDYAFVQAKLADNIELNRRDPTYKRKLDLLPEPYRSWQRDGNFSVGAGSALSQIDWRRHLIRPFTIPEHWHHFGSLDWGFAHPFAFGHWTVNEDGSLFLVETVSGMRLRPRDQVDRIQHRVPIDKLRYVAAGHDCWNIRKAEGNEGPSVADKYAAGGIYLTKANIDRIQGVMEVRNALEWENTGPDDEHGVPMAGDPRVRLFDTRENRKTLEQLEAMVEDPDDPEDVLKVDADDYGEGGDDRYDMFRYGICSKPLAPESPWKEEQPSAWDPEVLENEMRRGRRHRGLREKKEHFIPEPT